jgi:hypothetical protein
MAGKSVDVTRNTLYEFANEKRAYPQTYIYEDYLENGEFQLFFLLIY